MIKRKKQNNAYIKVLKHKGDKKQPINLVVFYLFCG